MAITARLPFAARRFELRTFTIMVRGLDLTGVSLGMQVRLSGDTPGAPLLSLATVTTVAAEGLKLESVATVDGLPVSTISGRINKASMSDAAGLGRVGEPGVPLRYTYAIRFAEVTRIAGDFWALPGTFDADNANPTGDYAGGDDSAPEPFSSATLMVAENEVVELRIDGAEILAALTDAAYESAAEAKVSEEKAAASAASINTTVEPTTEIVKAFVGSDDRMAMAIMDDASVLIPEPRDSNGLMTPRIDASTDAIADLQAAQALLPPENILRLKRASYDAPATVRVQSSSSVVSFSGADQLTPLVTGVVYDKADAKIGRLGGPWTLAGASYPSNLMLDQRNNIYYAGGPITGGNPQILLHIDAGVTQIGWMGEGALYVGVQIDGQLSAATGHLASPAPSGGGFRAHRLTLQSSASPRLVQIFLPRDAAVGDVQVNTGGSLLPLPARISPLVAFIGDSITEGTGATRRHLGWSQQTQLRLGIDSAAMAVGSSGWIKSIAQREKLSVRIPTLLTPKNGGPPDAAVIAMGVNDPIVQSLPNGGESGGITYVSHQAYQDEIRADMAAIRSGAPIMPIILLGPFGTVNGYNSDTQFKRDLIFEVVTEFNLVWTVDVQSWWSDPSDYTLWYEPADGVHPNNFGHSRMGQLAQRDILPILGAL